MEQTIVLITGGKTSHSSVIANVFSLLWVVANSGIGFELAAQLAADASKHVVLGSRSAEKGEAAVKELESRNLPGSVELVQLDVANEDSISAAVEQVQRKHGRYVVCDRVQPIKILIFVC